VTLDGVTLRGDVTVVRVGVVVDVVDVLDVLAPMYSSTAVSLAGR
jgi:hypothetical protein